MNTFGADEKTSLHDLANPLGIEMFMADIVLDEIQSRPNADLSETLSSGQLYAALEKVKKLLDDRRKILTERDKAHA